MPTHLLSPRFHLAAIATLATLLAACSSPCGKCGSGELCDVTSGDCVSKDATAAICSPGCFGNSPICDVTKAPPVCATCTATMGCGGFTPHCDVTVPGGQCVGCLTDFDCQSGQCVGSTQTCVPSVWDGGHGTGGGGGGGGVTGDGGGTEAAGGGNTSGGGGTGTGGGTSSGGGGATGGGGGGGIFTWDGGAYNGVGSCAPHTGPAQSCTPSCHDGFHCQAGSCELNGGSGPVQVTLRWNTAEDVDLHVREPTPGGGTCEIYYGDTNAGGNTSSCGAVGSLDLDSNAGCGIDNVDIENVIYPPHTTAPSGTYGVYIDYYENCDSTLQILPFEVEVRVNGNDMGMCGAFTRGSRDWDDSGSAGAGRLVMTFNVP